MSGCKFCEAMDDWKKAESVGTRFWPEKIMREYKSAIVIRTWTKEKGKKHAGRSTDYRRNGIGFDLNYCPECGKKLK